MNKIACLLTVLFCTLCTPTFSDEITTFNVEDTQSLISVPSPNFGIDQMTDPTFPRKLEKQGAFRSALLEWQRIAHMEIGNNRAKALFRVGRLHFELDEKQLAMQTFSAFADEFPTHPFLPQVLYWHSRAADDIMAKEPILQQLKQQFNGSLWQREALYRAVWDAVETGDAMPVMGLEDARANALLKQLQIVLADQTRHPQQTVLRSIIPGGGYFYLGHWQNGLVAAALILLLLIATAYAFKKRHWPYALIWGISLATVWLGSALASEKIAESDLRRWRMLAMASWADLHPMQAAEIEAAMREK